MDELFALRPRHNAHARLMADVQAEHAPNISSLGRTGGYDGDSTPEKDSRSLELNTA